MVYIFRQKAVKITGLSNKQESGTKQISPLRLTKVYDQRCPAFIHKLEQLKFLSFPLGCQDYIFIFSFLIACPMYIIRVLLLSTIRNFLPNSS